MKKILAILALSLATSVMAATENTVDVSKLTPQQVAQINQQVAEMQSQPVNVSASVRKEAEAWGELGSNMGRAMVGAAREVGVAANDFSQTSLGKIVVALVAYKLVGKELLGVVIGSGILALGYAVAIWLLTTRRWSKVVFEYEPVLWGMFKRRRVVSSDTESDVVATRVVSAGILIALTTLVGINLIF